MIFYTIKRPGESDPEQGEIGNLGQYFDDPTATRLMQARLAIRGIKRTLAFDMHRDRGQNHHIVIVAPQRAKALKGGL